MNVQQKIWNYFTDKGFTAQSVAGIMGNVDKESRFNPKAVQKNKIYSDTVYTNLVDSGIYQNFPDDKLGYGIVQWTYNTFKRDLLNRCKSMNKSIGDLDCQLEQLYSHLQSENLLNQMKNFTSIEEATTFFMLKFEKPEDQSEEAQKERIKLANKWYNTFAGGHTQSPQNLGGNKMKYNTNNPPIVCMMTNSTCYKSTSQMAVKGILWHSTGANNKTLKRYVQPSPGDPNYNALINIIGKNTNGNDWNSISIQAGLNAWVGALADGSVAAVQTMPWDYKPWGCGSGAKGSCNNGFIQFEICEDALVDGNYFMKAYQEACELTAYLCKLYNINPFGSVNMNGVDVPTILCHADSCQLGLGTNHSDVYHWFTRYGKSMDNVRQDVAKLLGYSGNTSTTEEPATSSTLKIGMENNPQVKMVQETLIKLGYNLGPDGADGDFGPMTERALQIFQSKNGLEANGIFGPETFVVMKKALQNLQTTAPLVEKDQVYRVRKSWDNPQSQIGAYTNMNNAKAAVDKIGQGYHVYDANGNEVYPNIASVGQPSSTTVAIQQPVARLYNGVKLASSSKDENGRYTGGQKGDQTGQEVHILNWYSNGWDRVLRPKNQTLAENIARAAEAGCANDNIGYSQGARNTLYIEAQKVGLDLSKITTPCDCDCSSFVSICCICAGLSPNIFYAGGNMCTTWTLQQACERTGQFIVYSNNQYTQTKDYLQRGDILLNTSSHATIVLSDGDKVERKVEISPTAEKVEQINEVNYRAQILVPVLNVRKLPNKDAPVVAQVKFHQIYTIVAEEGGFGKLKSGVGWINLSYVKQL